MCVCANVFVADERTMMLMMGSDPQFVEDTVFHELVENVINFSQVDKTYIVDEASTVHDAIHMFANNANRGMHRVAVATGTGAQAFVQDVLTQSDLVNFCAANAHLIPQVHIPCLMNVEFS